MFEKFVDIGSKECYVGMLYTCYDLLKLDVVMEIAWRNGLTDYTIVCYIIVSLRISFH